MFVGTNFYIRLEIGGTGAVFLTLAGGMALLWLLWWVRARVRRCYLLNEQLNTVHPPVPLAAKIPSAADSGKSLAAFLKEVRAADMHHQDVANPFGRVFGHGAEGFAGRVKNGRVVIAIKKVPPGT